jgi:hypothetical protein
MSAIEPNWVSSLWFAALATVCSLAFLGIAGMFPLRSQPAAARSVTATLLIAGNAVLLATLLLGTGFYGYSELRWSTLIVVAGLVVLFSPGLFQVCPFQICPSPSRDQSTGLLILVGVQLLALAALAKIAGPSLTNMS